MPENRPTGVTIIAILTLLGSMGQIVVGIILLAAGAFISGISSIGRMLAGILWAGGVVLLAIGGFTLMLSVGLLRMREWARVWGVVFFGTLMLLCFILFIFDFILIFGAVYYLFVVYYLRMPSTREAFEGQGYARPNLYRAVTRQQPYYESAPAQQPASSAAERKPADVIVPPGMVLCPGCQTINPRGEGQCRVCARALPQE